jgi:hypothetical protein
MKNLSLKVTRCIVVALLSACSGGNAQTSTLTPVPSDTPQSALVATHPPASSDRYDELPQAISLSGFPQVGFPNAPVSVTIYGSFGDPASGDFYANTFPPLLNRTRNGEVLLTFVTLAGSGAIANQQGAARAALCAAEQNTFWRFHDRLFEAARTESDPFAGERLIEIANSIGMNRAQWDECMISNRPDEILAEADRQVSNTEIFTQIPFVTVNEASSFLDSESLNFTIDQALEQFNQQIAEALAGATPEVTDDSILELPPVTSDEVAPPIIIGLPPGWRTGYAVQFLRDVDADRTIPVAVYQGPVTGGTGNIVLLWGFPNLNLVPEQGIPETATPDLWLDGVRLLRLAVVEAGCNVGTDLRREYNVGGLTAVGTQFAAVDCPELPDTRGWFAGLRQYNINFIFYVFTEPIEAMDVAEGELQAILNSIRFAAPPTPDPNATPTAGQ